MENIFEETAAALGHSLTLLRQGRLQETIIDVHNMEHLEHLIGISHQSGSSIVNNKDKTAVINENKVLMAEFRRTGINLPIKVLAISIPDQVQYKANTRTGHGVTIYNYDKLTMTHGAAFIIEDAKFVKVLANSFHREGPNPEGNYDFKIVGKDGRDGKNGADGHQGHNGYNGRHACDKRTSWTQLFHGDHGETGQDGQDGGNGCDGHSGGDSSMAIIQIAREFSSLSVYTQAGKGGRGGNGGVGGVGGNGGNGGNGETRFFNSSLGGAGGVNGIGGYGGRGGNGGNGGMANGNIFVYVPCQADMSRLTTNAKSSIGGDGGSQAINGIHGSQGIGGGNGKYIGGINNSEWIKNSHQSLEDGEKGSNGNLVQIFVKVLPR